TKRVRPAGRIFLAIPQKADEVPHCDMAEAQYQRIASGINELVDPARLEPTGDMDVAVGRDHRLDRTLGGDAGTTVDPGEGPIRRRYWYPLVIGIAPPRQTRLTRVERHGRMAAHRNATAQRKCCDPAAVGDVFDPDKPGQRSVALAGN